jgi:hypothetical protein
MPMETRHQRPKISAVKYGFYVWYRKDRHKKKRKIEKQIKHTETRDTVQRLRRERFHGGPVRSLRRIRKVLRSPSPKAAELLKAAMVSDKVPAELKLRCAEALLQWGDGDFSGKKIGIYRLRGHKPSGR